MTYHLIGIGIAFMVLSLVHVGFPWYFKWKKELASLSLINKQMMEVHTFFVALVVFLMGLLCVFETDALLTTPLGKRILQGFTIFWIFRWLAQFFYYSPKLWRGKLFETTMHILFSLFWTYITTVFAYLSLQNPN